MVDTEGAGPGEKADRAVFFADVVDSTRLYAEWGDEAARGLLLRCLGVMAGAVERNRGRVLERIGDELLCLFDAADDAARAAAAVHSALEQAGGDGTLSRPMSARVGFEHGPSILEGGKVFGSTVNTAARLAAAAKAGQSLTTRETLERLHPAVRRLSRFIDRVGLKGQPGERELYEMLWDPRSTVAASALTPVSRWSGAHEVADLGHQGTVYRIDADSPRLELGRHAACGLQVNLPSVSKLHARVVWERGRVRVEDLSTNGTFVETGDAEPVFLHRESLALAGRGRLLLGARPPEDECAVVAFEVVSSSASVPSSLR